MKPITLLTLVALAALGPMLGGCAKDEPSGPPRSEGRFLAVTFLDEPQYRATPPPPATGPGEGVVLAVDTCEIRRLPDGEFFVHLAPGGQAEMYTLNGVFKRLPPEPSREEVTAGLATWIIAM